MKNLAERANKAVVATLERKGYEQIGSTERGPVMIDDGMLVFVSVLVRMADQADGFATDCSSRKTREMEACNWLMEHEDYLMPIRFDEISLLVVSDDRAMLRHHINCFGL